MRLLFANHRKRSGQEQRLAEFKLTAFHELSLSENLTQSESVYKTEDFINETSKLGDFPRARILQYHQRNRYCASRQIQPEWCEPVIQEIDFHRRAMSQFA